MAVQNYGAGGGFQISPGVSTAEVDLTTTVPSVDTTAGAIAGVFHWGPIGERVRVSQEKELVSRFGKPSNLNPETFFVASNFLAYSNDLYVSRAGATSNVFSAVANTGPGIFGAGSTIKNREDYEAKDGNIEAAALYVAKYPGSYGNSLKISVCETPEQYSQDIDIRGGNTSFDNINSSLTLDVGSKTALITLANSAALTSDTPIDYANEVVGYFNVGDYLTVGNNSIGRQSMKITGISSVVVANTSGTNTGYASFTLELNQPLKLSTNINSNTASRQWEYFNQVDSAPGTSDHVAAFGNSAAIDEIHVVVTDEGGAFTGAPGTVLEVFSDLSRATDAKTTDGGQNYYKSVINNRSNYVWFANDRTGAESANAANIATSTNLDPLSLRFTGGSDVSENDISFGDVASAYDMFKMAEEVDVSLVMTGKARGGAVGEQLANYVIDNITETRKDCIAFVSPSYDAVVSQHYDAVQNTVEFRNALRSTSYAVMDSGYKYQYDKYNDVYRWVPLNGDIAGLCVYTDGVRDPWYSPAGVARGQIKNVIKLSHNPDQSDRDLLYKNGINPVITLAGQGTILYGDKTLLSQPSAFDRINVRRLFIVLEKAISNAAKSYLFEFNDEFTRAQFVNTVEPFLRDVQGRRGITDFRVVCDSTNNTPEVIDSNRLVGDIWVRPTRSVNFIRLNFVAVRSGVSFEEILG